MTMTLIHGGASSPSSTTCICVYDEPFLSQLFTSLFCFSRRTWALSHLQLQQPSQPSQLCQPYQSPEPLFNGVWLSGLSH